MWGSNYTCAKNVAPPTNILFKTCGVSSNVMYYKCEILSYAILKTNEPMIHSYTSHMMHN